MRNISWLLAGLTACGVASSCSSEHNPAGGQEAVGETGQITVALTSVPADVACLKVSITGSRAVTQLIDVTPGGSANQTINRLPIGIVTVSAEAFSKNCNAVAAGTVPTYVIDAPVLVRVDAVDVNSVTLNLVRNGRLGIGVDFENGPQAYILSALDGVTIKPLLTVGDSVNNKPNGTPYRLVGLPDGQGALDNGDGTFTLLVNHEVAGGGAVRAHGATGAFVSKWRIRKSDLTVLHGEDLIQNVVRFDAATAAYLPPATGVAMGRFCSADLPPLSAFYDAASGSGYNGRLFMNGEETGAEGRAFAHALNGTSWELPRLGKFSWENSLANPATGTKTAVIGTDDSTPGQVYLYIGTKTTTGSAVQQAGLTNGTLYGIAVTGVTTEPSATGIASGTAFTAAALGNVETISGATLEANSVSASVTRFNRPEDGHWDPQNPADFYFVTTASFSTPSRLWRLRFSDINNLAAGGTLDMLLDGTEGQKMLDNMTVTKGHVYLQEDPGNNAHLAKIWRYTIATDTLTLIAQHNPALFTSGSPAFLTQDEETSGIIDASDVIGPGWFLINSQGHYATDSELIEGGQLLAMFDPAAQ